MHRLVCDANVDNIEVQNALLDMFCKCSDIDSAEQLWSDMRERQLMDNVSYTTMMNGFVSVDQSESDPKIVHLFQKDVAHVDVGNE